MRSSLPINSHKCAFLSLSSLVLGTQHVLPWMNMCLTTVITLNSSRGLNFSFSLKICLRIVTKWKKVILLKLILFCLTLLVRFFPSYFILLDLKITGNLYLFCYISVQTQLLNMALGYRCMLNTQLTKHNLFFCFCFSGKLSFELHAYELHVSSWNF